VQEEQVEEKDRKLDSIIIVVSTEVLKGSIKEANLSWLIERLSELDFEVVKGIIVRDDPYVLEDEIRRALHKVNFIFVIGGLGPTSDDKTRYAVASALDRPLVLSEEAILHLKKYYSERGIKLEEYRMKMAEVVEGSSIIPNPVGAAPGMMINVGESTIFVLPGVPVEMRAIFERIRQILFRNDVNYKKIRFKVESFKEAELYRILEYGLRGFREKVYFKVLVKKPLEVYIEYPNDSSIEIVIKSLLNMLVNG